MEAEWIVLFLAAFAAGFVDAVAGGGGLIQVPALLAAFPGAAPAVLLGTNKLSSIFGTASASWRYLRRIPIEWRLVTPAAIAAFGFSFVGAASVALLPEGLIRPIVFSLLVMVVIYVALQPNFGVAADGLPRRDTGVWQPALVGAALGFYDGFLGPGTGSFLIFCFVRFFGMDFLRASSSAKVVNLATNAAALCFFLPTGNVLWGLGLGMALSNIAGAQMGARAALRGGSVWVRKVFLLVSTALLVKVGSNILNL